MEKVVEEKERRTKEKSAVSKLVSTAHTEITNEKDENTDSKGNEKIIQSVNLFQEL